LDIPVVVTCDAHYLKHEDQDAHEMLLCVGTGAFLSDEKRMSLKNYPLHVEDPMRLLSAGELSTQRSLPTPRLWPIAVM
jgi:DNA polymerase-3 subunit alpha